MNCILFNRLLSPVLLNKSGLVRAKAGSFTLKTLNGCFSNYYQVRTWPVFAEKVTYNLLLGAISQYGLPSRIRCDQGGENIRVAQHMLHHQGIEKDLC